VIDCDLVVLAKAPAPGRTKTRCTPPCTPEEAAVLAAATLRDTLAVALATPARRHVLVLDGAPGEWLPPGFDVLPQRGDGLDERLDAAFADVAGATRVAAAAPVLLIAMDTPQVSVALLTAAAQRLAAGADAVLGPACDGGYWAVGLQGAVPGAFAGVPMSAATTGRDQRRRFDQLGLRVETLPVLRDVDTWADAVALAPTTGTGCFAGAVRRISGRIAAGR